MSRPTSRCLHRLMSELRSLQTEPSTAFNAAPDPSNILKWCFVFDGTKGTPFEGGRYVGEIHFENDFPMKPPKLLFLTPNGRFKTNQAICLSNTSFHPEKWSPVWTIRTILTALIAFMTVEESGIGSLSDSEARRRQLARESRKFNVKHLAYMYQNALPDVFAADERIVNELRDAKQVSSMNSGSSLAAGDGETGATLDENAAHGSTGDETLQKANRPSPMVMGFVMFFFAALMFFFW